MAGTYTAAELSVDVTGEKADLLVLLADQRALFKVTVQGITEEQARQQTTVSTLTLGGLLKHLATVEREIAQMLVDRDENAEMDLAAIGDAYALGDGDTVQEWIEAYDRAGALFDQTIAGVESMDELIPQPTAPWAPERVWWTVRRVSLHLLRETAHHCGHADIIREALDGQSTMTVISGGMDWSDA
ncbi:MAG: DinB family protein [Propionibacteriaceae bacterium]